MRGLDGLFRGAKRDARLSIGVCVLESGKSVNECLIERRLASGIQPPGAFIDLPGRTMPF